MGFSTGIWSVNRAQYFIHQKFLFILPIWIDYHILWITSFWMIIGSGKAAISVVRIELIQLQNTRIMWTSNRFEQSFIERISCRCEKKIQHRWKMRIQYPLITPHTHDQFHWIEQFPLFLKHSSVQVEGEYRETHNKCNSFECRFFGWKWNTSETYKFRQNITSESIIQRWITASVFRSH